MITQNQYKEKYLKVKNKYLSLKQNLTQINNIHGGFIKIDSIDGDFLKDWYEIPQSGQKNCGIFINNKKPDRIMKCERRSGSDYITENKIDKLNKSTNYEIFPIIYSITTFKKSVYTEMERFDGDVTDLLLHMLPKEIIKTMGFSEQIQDDILFIYETMIPRTEGRQIELSWFDESIFYFYKNPNELQNLTDINKNQYGIKKWIRLEDVKEYIDSFSKVVNKLGKSQVTLDQYKLFMNNLNDQLIIMIPEVTKQIFMLQYRLYELGYAYSDMKYDNFGFTLSDTQKEYLGVNFINNEFNGKYYYIHILDWGSGFFNSDDYTQTGLLKLFNSTELLGIHGQYSLKPINRKLLESFDFLNDYFSKEIIKIITNSFEFNFDFPKKNFTTIDQIVSEIDPISELKKNIGQYYLFNKINNEKYNIILSGHNNSVQLEIQDNNRFVITYLDDHRKPSIPNRLWPSGEVIAPSIKQVILLIKAAYAY